MHPCALLNMSSKSQSTLGRTQCATATPSAPPERRMPCCDLLSRMLVELRDCAGEALRRRSIARDSRGLRPRPAVHSLATPQSASSDVPRMPLRGHRPRPCAAARALFAPLLFACRSAEGVGADVCVWQVKGNGNDENQPIGRHQVRPLCPLAPAERRADTAEPSSPVALACGVCRRAACAVRPFPGRCARWRGRTSTSH